MKSLELDLEKIKERISEKYGEVNNEEYVEILVNEVMDEDYMDGYRKVMEGENYTEEQKEKARKIMENLKRQLVNNPDKITKLSSIIEYIEAVVKGEMIFLAFECKENQYGEKDLVYSTVLDLENASYSSIDESSNVKFDQVYIGSYSQKIDDEKTYMGSVEIGGRFSNIIKKDNEYFVYNATSYSNGEEKYIDVYDVECDEKTYNEFYCRINETETNEKLKQEILHGEGPVPRPDQYYYSARKSFSSFKEAIDAICDASYSLDQSDLSYFSFKDVEDYKLLQEKIDDYNEENEYNTFYPAYVSLRMGKEGPVFEYTTGSGINNVVIEEKIAEDESKYYDTAYYNQSYNPMNMSSSMKSFGNAGWDCCCEAISVRTPDNDNVTLYNFNEEDNKVLQKIGEEVKKEKLQEIIERMQEHRRIPGVSFSLSYSTHENYVPSITGYSIQNFTEEIYEIVEHHPEVKELAVEIAKEQIESLNSLEIPTTYEYNESIFVDSNYYIEQRDAVVESLKEVVEKYQEKEQDDKVFSAESIKCAIKEIEKNEKEQIEDNSRF